MGGRSERGGIIADFFIPEYNLIINVASVYWHYARPGAIANDQMQRATLESQGIRVIYIDEEDALSNPIYYVKLALQGIDKSRMTGGHT